MPTLTGVPNRALLCAQADQLLEAAGPTGAGAVTAVCLGLDGFGVVNDAYGAATADRVLVQVGARLTAEGRGDDMLGRLGGDVFAVAARSMGDERAAIRLAGRLRHVVSTTLDLDVVAEGIETPAHAGC